MARMASRPMSVKAWYRRIPYLLDLVRCRRALVQRQIEGGLDSMESLAAQVGISRSTASRFFSGRPTSLSVTLRILEALGLQFHDVARPSQPDGDPEDEAEGPMGAMVAAVKPGGPQPGGVDQVASRPAAMA
jgi:hypothetical protein